MCLVCNGVVYLVNNVGGNGNTCLAVGDGEHFRHLVVLDEVARFINSFVCDYSLGDFVVIVFVVAVESYAQVAGVGECVAVCGLYKADAVYLACGKLAHYAIGQLNGNELLLGVKKHFVCLGSCDALICAVVVGYIVFVLCLNLK